jgi:hypothetical protein
MQYIIAIVIGILFPVILYSLERVYKEQDKREKILFDNIIKEKRREREKGGSR